MVTPRTALERRIIFWVADRFEVDESDVVEWQEFPDVTSSHDLAVAFRRLEESGLLENVYDGGWKARPEIVAAAEEIRNPPPPGYRESVTRWFWGRRWSVAVLGLAIGFPLVVQWIEGLRTILSWFGLGDR